MIVHYSSSLQYFFYQSTIISTLVETSFVHSDESLCMLNVILDCSI